MRIAGLIPLSWKYVPVDFTFSLLNMQRYAQGKYEIDFIVSAICYIDFALNDLIGKALFGKYDYMLFLAADMTYPKDIPERLIKYIDSGKSIVGGLAPVRYDGLPMLYYFTNEKPNSIMMKRYTDIKGIMKVDASSISGSMMNPEIFNKFKFPYFKTGWSEVDNKYVGEDISFYKQCKDKDIDVWCDTDLKYGHLDVVDVTRR